jgi:putative Holliday junction resolvase
VTEGRPFGPVLALDVGDRRIGVAVSDALGITAHGLATIVRRSDRGAAEAVARHVDAQGAVALVVGEPRMPSGDLGEQARKVARFVQTLTAHVSVPTFRWDESYSTLAARERMPMRRKGGSTIGVDAEAAAVILQEWLDAEHAARQVLGSDRENSEE